MKLLLTTALSLIILSTIPFAASRYNLDDFEKGTLNGGLGLTILNDQKYIQTGLAPDLKYKGLEVGLGVNFFIPLEDYASKPDDLQLLTLRYVSYNHHDRWGVKWGRLSNITFGYGLLMNNYDSGSGGSTQFINEKAGILGYGTIGQYRGDVMYTASKVQAGRLSYTFSRSPFMGRPIIIGATVVNDDNGINDNDTGKQITRPSQLGYGVDIGIPIVSDMLTLYTEVAHLDQSGDKKGPGGTGAAVGATGQVLSRIDYRAEYRHIEKSFIPGYFNSTYEATSFDFSNNILDADQSGFLASASTQLMDGHVRAGATYEYYKDQQLATASLGWKQIGNTIGVVNYTVPFQGRSNAILEADIIYVTGGFMDYIMHYKRTYSTNSKYTESYSFGTRIRLDSIFPNLPL